MERSDSNLFFVIKNHFRSKQSAFTIVELLVVIVVIGILATITAVAYVSVREKAAVAVMSSDLRNAASAFEMYKAENIVYPTDISVTSAKVNNDYVMQSATTTAGNFCVNIYHKTDPNSQMSWNSSVGLQDGLCDGATIGNPIGGVVPTAARGMNVMPGFERWVLTGGATYNVATEELTLGVNGIATSPLIRIDQAAGIRVGADFYATTSSPYASFTPRGGYHDNISYYIGDGSTPATNSSGYTSNGCAHDITLNTWNLAETYCLYNGGPQVVYVKMRYYGSSASYASSDLKLRSPLLILNN